MGGLTDQLKEILRENGCFFVRQGKGEEARWDKHLEGLDRSRRRAGAHRRAFRARRRIPRRSAHPARSPEAGGEEDVGWAKRSAAHRRSTRQDRRWVTALR